ncbi:MAG: ATP-binding cassette domain-containing protein [Deltaproteobacteria bacterium]|nr:ATP-binding cassette domain-containing protein [Deltaproteobacteria bacterium]
MPGYDRTFVQVNKVSMHFGLVEAVRQVPFDVTQGTIFGLVGSDGAGKSTLLRMIATMIKPASGTILIDGLGGRNGISAFPTFCPLPTARRATCPAG